MVNDGDTIELGNENEELPCICKDTDLIRVDCSVPYNTFFRTFLENNRPCIVKCSSVQTWESSREWTSEGLPNFTLLQNQYGNITVPVADCGKKYYNVQKKCPILFSEYLDYWKKYIENDYPCDMPCMYLKDWHFTKDFPSRSIYRVPKYFASDWLNEYLTSRSDVNDDYRFVYMGPKGSWTPLHADVFTSYSWSINVSGKKRWLLFPPGQEKYLCDKHGNLIYDATCAELLDCNLYPEYQKLTPYDVIQEAGEAIFVPTGWHHQVWNLEDTISINHNWINGCNIGKMWLSMQGNLNDVKREIEDCQDMEDWEEHCQIMLLATFGMNYEEFSKFIQYIARHRLDSLKNDSPIILYGDWKLGVQHLLFDLQQVLQILMCFLSNRDVQVLKFHEVSHKSLEDLSIEIQQVLSQLNLCQISIDHGNVA